ncbi:MAG: hypothetical protein R3182_12830, partial [Draconibacterium sp.]|nr:hypothetical protein [Draconibacterium sp.]
MKKVILIGIIFCLSGISGFSQNSFPSENIYWPGNFESALYGGCFSRARGVEITNSENYSINGKHSWYL